MIVEAKDKPAARWYVPAISAMHESVIESDAGREEPIVYAGSACHWRRQPADTLLMRAIIWRRMAFRLGGRRRSAVPALSYGGSCGSVWKRDLEHNARV